MRMNFNEIRFNKATIQNSPAVFTKNRIERSSIPEGLYLYEIRHSDRNWEKPLTVENWVLVNYYGSLVSPLKLEFDEKPDNYIPYSNNVKKYGHSYTSGQVFYEQLSASQQDQLEPDGDVPEPDLSDHQSM